MSSSRYNGRRCQARLCHVEIAGSPVALPPRRRWPPMAASSPRQSYEARPAACRMSPSTKSAAWRSTTWWKTARFITGYATSCWDQGPASPASTRIWRSTLHLARVSITPLSLHLVRGGGPQPGPVRTPQTGIAAPALRSAITVEPVRPACPPPRAKRFLNPRLLPERENPPVTAETDPPNPCSNAEKSAFMDGH